MRRPRRVSLSLSASPAARTASEMPDGRLLNTRRRSTMRPSRATSTESMAPTPESRNTGATATWMPCTTMEIPSVCMRSQHRLEPFELRRPEINSFCPARLRMRPPKGLRFSPVVEGRSRLPNGMGGEQGAFLVGRTAQQVELLEARHGGEIGLAMFPDFDELLLTARRDLETIHGNEHTGSFHRDARGVNAAKTHSLHWRADKFNIDYCPCRKRCRITRGA